MLKNKLEPLLLCWLQSRFKLDDESLTVRSRAKKFPNILAPLKRIEKFGTKS
jgi:hypothetical protein